MTPATTVAPAATRTIEVEVWTTSTWVKCDTITFEVPSSISDEELEAYIEESAAEGELEDPKDGTWINGMKCVAFDEGSLDFAETAYCETDFKEVKAD